MSVPARRTPFVSQLRSRPGVIRLGAPDEAVFALRVEMPDVWDTVRIDAPPSTPAVDVKRVALDALFPEGQFLEDFVLKLHGFEVMDEQASIAEAGARDGSIFLLTFRRRRPVR
ncbi:MAG TPA: hypothetical protein VFS08_13115 [Gemmatimonadaceae bacterium]|nr:hypothetical protein [Gemmatimonadaceae bacterium]